MERPLASQDLPPEPGAGANRPVEPEDLEHFFLETLPAVVPGWEERAGQLEMAQSVARSLGGEGTLSVEAGTGTGKSLAYLVPAVLWAVQNQSKVVVSTYTRSLQAQLMGSDIPMLRAAGLDFGVSLLKGRANYLCRRKLAVALAEDALVEGEPDPYLARVRDWAARSVEGSIQDFGEAEEDDAWEAVASNTDHTLQKRCPHFDQCFYYEARRKAAMSQLLIVNHALWVADLHIKSTTGGDGLLPRYDRVVLDEAHHLEDAVVSVSTTKITSRRIARAVNPLLGRRRKKGALQRLREGPAGREPAVHRLSERAADPLVSVKEHTKATLETLGATYLFQEVSRRMGKATPLEAQELQGALQGLEEEIGAASDALAALLERSRGVEIPTEKMQPVLDLSRAQRLLREQAAMAGVMAQAQEGWCRWLESSSGVGGQAAICRAPIAAGPLLKRLAWDPLSAVVLTSATLAVQGRFSHFHDRHGIESAETLQVTSPFDYKRQAILGLPKDLPSPVSPGSLAATVPVVLQLLRASGGGAFVLCTSHEAVRTYARAIEAELGDSHPVYVQGRRGRERLLADFRGSHKGILVGTDSFWEGVSVPGAGLRLVIIPRLPFRVPTDPVAQARYEHLEAQGRDPFRALSLPQAVLRLRQGFGRLVRTQKDRGAVVVLDRRLHERWYGRVFLMSLPPAQRVVGPSRRVVERLQAFYQQDKEQQEVPQ